VNAIGFTTYLASGVAYTLLLALLLVGWHRQKGPGIWLIAACATTAIWSFTVAANYAVARGYALTGRPLEVVHSGGWLAFLIALLEQHWERAGRPHLRRLAFGGLAVGIVTVLVFDYTAVLRGDDLFERQMLLAGTFARLIIAVTGWVLIENLYRNTELNDRWRIRFLCIALAALFGFDFYLYADAVLLESIDVRLYEARGVALVLVMPLIAIAAARNKTWSLEIFVSRRVVFHTASLVASGIYLLAMATVGFYLRQIGGQWGTVFQVGFLFGAVVLLAVTLFSGRFRSRLRVLIAKHFFHYKYDYREEWLRFIKTVSSDDDTADLRQRVIEAIANIADSPAGGLWLHGGPDHYALAATWNMPDDIEAHEPVDGPLVRFLAEREWIIDLAEYGRDPEVYDGLVLPAWLSRIPRAWLVVPLLHRGRLTGFMVLSEPRAPRELNWEDRDLLKTVGRQVASYLAEQASQMALAEARQFEDFNRRFAFVLHDIKNLVSQLSLLIKNASRHAGNPEFQKDMITTVRESVDKMNRLLGRLHEAGEDAAPRETVDLSSILRQVVDERAGNVADLRFDCDAGALPVAADGDRLATVFGHLVQNAIDAVDGRGRIEVRARRDGDMALVEIEDDGPGMDQDFIRNQLFRPFRSTKKTGYGIGAFESRQVITELGGRIDVDSAPREGTILSVHLPLLKESKVNL